MSELPAWLRTAALLGEDADALAGPRETQDALPAPTADDEAALAGLERAFGALRAEHTPDALSAARKISIFEAARAEAAQMLAAPYEATPETAAAASTRPAVATRAPHAHLEVQARRDKRALWAASAALVVSAAAAAAVWLVPTGPAAGETEPELPSAATFVASKTPAPVPHGTVVFDSNVARGPVLHVAPGARIGRHVDAAVQPALHVSLAPPSVEAGRRTLNALNGRVPLEDAVDVAALVHALAPAPLAGATETAVRTEVGPCPWDASKMLARIDVVRGAFDPASERVTLALKVNPAAVTRYRVLGQRVQTAQAGALPSATETGAALAPGAPVSVLVEFEPATGAAPGAHALTAALSTITNPAPTRVLASHAARLPRARERNTRTFTRTARVATLALALSGDPQAEHALRTRDKRKDALEHLLDRAQHAMTSTL